MLSVLAAGTYPLPEQASTIASESDFVMWFIIWVSIISGAAVFIGTIILAMKYHHKPGVNDKGVGPAHSTLLEVTWSVIPGILLAMMAIWGFKGYLNISEQPPGEALEIRVEAKKWAWNFVYPNGYQDSQLHIPKGKTVRLVLTSSDVLHSLFLVQFRNKKDCVPGRYNKMWVEATETSPIPAGMDPNDPKSYENAPTTPNFGFDIYCAEYCGKGHSEMLQKVHVHESEEAFNAWLKKASVIPEDVPGVKIGEMIVKKNGCATCHSVDGSKGTGPTWKDIYGRKASWADGQSYTVTDAYIKDSIIKPSHHIVAGFGNAMSVYNIPDREIAGIIEYMKSITAGHENDPSLQKPIPMGYRIPIDENDPALK